MIVPHCPWLLLPDEELPEALATPERWSLISEVPAADLLRRRNGVKDSRKVHWADESDGSDAEPNTWSKIERRQEAAGETARDLGPSGGSKSSSASETWEFPNAPFDHTPRDGQPKLSNDLSHFTRGISCMFPSVSRNGDTGAVRRDSGIARGLSKDGDSLLASPAKSERSNTSNEPATSEISDWDCDLSDDVDSLEESGFSGACERDWPPVSTHAMTTRSGRRRNPFTWRARRRGGCLWPSYRRSLSSESFESRNAEEQIERDDSHLFGDALREQETCEGHGAAGLSSSAPPSLSSPAADASEAAEVSFLRSNLFNPQTLRPVSDLSQIFSTVKGVFGEPGTGLLPARFAPPTGAYRLLGETLYAVNSSVRSRHVDIEMLKTKIPHHVLLSYNLNPEARIDAIKIGARSGGDASGAVDATFVRPRLFGRTISRGRTCRPSLGRREHGGSGMFNSREGNRRRNSDPKAWLVGADGQRKRRRESDFYEDIKERDSELRKRNKVARAIEEGDLNKAAREMGSSDASTAQWSDLLTWRLIKLSADVEVDGEKKPGSLIAEKKVETHVSWWAVPQKTIAGGLF